MIDPHPLWHALQQHVIKSMPEYSVKEQSGGGVTTTLKEQGTESRAQGIEPLAKEEI